MNGAGVMAVAANQDQHGSQFLLMRPVIMRGALSLASIKLTNPVSFEEKKWLSK